MNQSKIYIATNLQKQDRVSLPSLCSAAQPECTCDKKQCLCLHRNVRTKCTKPIVLTIASSFSNELLWKDERSWWMKRLVTCTMLYNPLYFNYFIIFQIIF